MYSCWGKIPSLKNEIDQLQRHGFWVSEALVINVLKEVGEF
ncbi:MAG: hypothetical protein B5M51_09410 [Anaerolinea sp. 4484_236]|nr:MAG: hypothetical protein B5M51_09410 [Anaerolinea sp. 4484_236]RLD11420.1 MAG: hypothetical protein DRI56_01060 [Chloroflexota bacterium]